MKGGDEMKNNLLTIVVVAIITSIITSLAIFGLTGLKSDGPLFSPINGSRIDISGDQVKWTSDSDSAVNFAGGDVQISSDDDIFLANDFFQLYYF